MDEDTRDLVNRLCTRAGMIMEDISTAAVMLPADAPNAAQAIDRMNRDVDTIARLIKAASELVRAEKR